MIKDCYKCFDNEERLLRENPYVREKVRKYLAMKGLDTTLKGFSYLEDIIALSLVRRKYSRTTIAELTPYIAYKNGIKDFSVQRQLRYCCTIKNHYKPIDICEKAWYELMRELEKEKQQKEKEKRF